MSIFPQFVLRARAHKTPLVPLASISISPSNPTQSGDPTILMVITADGAGSVIITQSGDLVDADFDDTLVSTADAAATADANVTFNTGTQRVTFLAAGVFQFLRIIESAPPAGQDYTLTLSAPLGGLALGIASATFTTTEDQTEPAPSGPVMFGINLASADFGSTVTQVLDSTYTYPTTGDVDYFYDRGFRLFRIPFRWSRVQPTILGSLSTADIARLDTLAAHIATKGDAIFFPDMHEFVGRRPTTADSTVTLGTAPVTTAALADLWIRMATEERSGVAWTDYGDACRIGVFNEPQGPSFTAAEWAALLVGTLNQMRDGGVTQTIHIPGAFWTGAKDWVTNGNAAAYETTVLPNLPAGGGYVVEVHQYLDEDSSGTSSTATEGAGSARLVAFSNWARANLPVGIKACIGEFGFANNTGMFTEAAALLDYAAANSDVFESWCAWGGGPWWSSNYPYILQPGNTLANPVERPQMFLLLDYTFPIATQHAPADLSLSNSIMSSAGALGQKIGTLTLVDQDVGEFTRWTAVDNAGSRLRVIGKEVQYGTVVPTSGQTYQGTFSGMDRGGNTLQKTFSFPTLAAPNIGLTRTNTQTVDEGQNFVFRYTVSSIVPGVKWRTWCSGDVPPQMQQDLEWEDVHRTAFEAKGYNVTRLNHTTVEIEMTNSSIAGTVDVTWQTLADHQTEGVNFQANFFMDHAQGCTLSPSVLTNFIRDASLTPGWSVSIPGSVFPGDTLTHQFILVNPAVGAKVIITPSGTSADSDFTATFDTVMGAAATANGFCTWNAGTNELAVTNAAFGTLTVDRIVAVDADSDETYIVTLSAPTSSVIAVASATSLLREDPGSATVDAYDFSDGETELLTPHTRAGEVQYDNGDGSWTAIAADALCAGPRGVLFGPEDINLIRNPRGEGGTLGSITLPTGWSAPKWVFVGRGEEDGKPYIELSRNYTTLEVSGFMVFGPFSDNPVVLNQMYQFQFGIRCVTGTFPNVWPEIRGTNASGSKVQQLFGVEIAVGPEIVWCDWSTALTSTSVTNVLPVLNVKGVLQTGLVTIRIYSPLLRIVPNVVNYLGLQPSDSRARHACLPTSGTIALSSVDDMAADFDYAPPDEGTIILDFDSVTRYGGECLLSIFSDADNYIEVRHEQFGALGIYVAKNGSLSVQLTDPITQTAGGYITAGFRHKLALVYGLFDVRLVLDGRLLASAAPTELPTVDTIRICRDRNDANFANNYIRSITIRDDLRSTADLLEDTKKSGLLGSPGINIDGLEFGSLMPGVSGVDYFPNSSTQTAKSAGSAYWAAKLGASYIRIPFKWNRVQTALLGALDTTYLGRIDTMIDGFWAEGMQSIPDMHNYMLYKINDPNYSPQVPSTIVGTEPVTVASLVDVWERLATHWLDNPAIRGFDLMNEPGLTGQALFDCLQAVINAIAAIDPTRKLYIEGNANSAMSGWCENNKTPPFINLTHPADNDLLIFSGHSYYDNNRSGVYSGSYTTEKGTPERALWNMMSFLQWRIAHGLDGNRAHIGEAGFPSASTWVLTGSNGVKIYHENNIEVSHFAAGQGWDPSYPLSTEPTGGIGAKVDRAQLTALTRHKYQA